MPTVAATVAAAAGRLHAAGFTADDALRDAAVIARGLLGWSLADWLSHRDTAATLEFLGTFEPLITRRAGREPVAYLLGTREFYGRLFTVAPGVLVPRPETEGIIEAARPWLRDRPAALVADVGTGSGCLAITLALECPGARVLATDQSPDALAIARANGDRFGAAVEWRHTDLLAGLPGGLDLIVSNPPYVPERDRAALPPDVRDFEPPTALFAGDDGLDVVRRLVPAAATHLRPGGLFLCEVGAGQRDAVTALLHEAGFVDIRWMDDLQGIPRIVSAERS